MTRAMAFSVKFYGFGEILFDSFFSSSNTLTWTVAFLKIGVKAKHLLPVSHITKTIDHHHHQNLWKLFFKLLMMKGSEEDLGLLKYPRCGTL